MTYSNVLKIFRYQPTVEMADEPMLCAGPGCTEHVIPGFDFCHKCGTQVNEVNMVKCRNCQSFVKKNTKFCSDCGTLFLPLTPVKQPLCSCCEIQLQEHNKCCLSCGFKVIDDEGNFNA